MKKVLILAAAAMLFAVPAFSAITNTAHDLSSTSTASIKGTITEICVYCHTPHGATAAGFAPLWNRTTINPLTAYGNPAGTMNATPALSDVQASDAALCLSCHDGASLTSALNNPPNSGGAVPTVQVGTNATIGTDLSNDHPVGFAYDAALVTADGELADPPTSQLFGAGNDMMWCSSCHDVHDDTNRPFLLVDNAGSALCLTCHVK